MRNFKKLSAVVVALALVLTTLVPAFAAYAPVNGAKAQTLNKLGLYEGTSTTEFKPALESELTRGQGAVLISKMFGMDDAAMKLTDAQTAEMLKGFADVSKVPNYAMKRMAYLVNAGIMTGNKDTTTGKVTLDANKSLLGGQYATLILKQMGYTVPSWSESVAQLAKVDGAKDVATYESYSKKNILRDHAVGIMYGSLTAKYSDGKATIIEKIVAAKPELKKIAIEAGLIAAPTELKVEGVKALNAKQIEIKFNAAVEKDSAETESFYEIKDKGLNTIELGNDSAVLVNANTVVITLDKKATDRLTNSSEAKVTVKKDMKTATGTTKLAADFVDANVKVIDSVIPSVEKVEATGDSTLKVTFSEPVYNGTDLTIANQNITVKSGNYTYYVQNAVADTAKKTITLTVGTKLIEGPITVTVNAAGVDVAGSIRDFAGYPVFKGESTFTYAKDSTVPVITVKEAKQESIKLAFSKPVKATDLKLFHSVNGVAAYVSKPVTTNGLVDEITFTFENKIPTGNVKLFLVNSTVSGSALVDGFGIKVPDQILSTEIIVDVTGPVVSSTKLNTNTSFEILFDEDVNETEARKAANYSVKTVADGKDVNFSIAFDKTTNAKKVTLNIPGNLSDNTQYQVVVKAMKDIAGNAMASEAAFTFTVSDHTNPTVFDKYAVNKDGKIYLTFSEPMNKTQMADKTNYAVKATSAAIYAALGENDTLTVLSDRKVVIDLYNREVATPDVKIAGITDMAGKKLGTDVDFVYEVKAIGQEEVKIATADLIAKNKIKLTFNKELASFDNMEFKFVKVGTDDSFKTDLRIQSVESMNKNSDGNTEVTLVTDRNVVTDATYETVKIDVKTVAAPANTKSVSGTVLKGATAATVADKLAAEVVVENEKAKVTISDFSKAPVNGRVESGVTAKVSVYFTEDMNLSSMSTLTYTVAGYTVTGIALNADGSTVELTVKANSDTTATPNVTQNYNITDANANIFAAGAVWTTIQK